MRLTELEALRKEAYKVEYAALKDMVEAALESYLPEVDSRSSVLGDAMRYSLEAGGKRLRPVLLLAAAKLAGGSRKGKPAAPCESEVEARMGGNADELREAVRANPYPIPNHDCVAESTCRPWRFEGESKHPIPNLDCKGSDCDLLQKALPYACAVEFIHTYSLIHDDHPSMDNDDLRRGRPANHKVYGDGIALLAGDGLLNSAFDVMLEAAQAAAGKDELLRFIRAAAEISKAAGVQGMIAGQASDFCMTDSAEICELKPPTANSGKTVSDNTVIDNSIRAASGDDTDMLHYIHRNKTGALIRAAVRAGAVIGGASDELLEALTSYAENLGLVFQIVDDLLDVIGDEKAMGKATGVDAELGKLTYPSLYGTERSRKLAGEITAEAVAAIEKASRLINNANMNDAPDRKCDKTEHAPILFFAELALDLQKRIK